MEKIEGCHCVRVRTQLLDDKEVQSARAGPLIIPLELRSRNPRRGLSRTQTHRITTASGWRGAHTIGLSTRQRKGSLSGVTFHLKPTKCSPNGGQAKRPRMAAGLPGRGMILGLPKPTFKIVQSGPADLETGEAMYLDGMMVMKSKFICRNKQTR